MTSQKKLIIIFALFIIPLGSASLWYGLLPNDYKPSSTTNNGNFIEPVYPVKNFSQQTLNNETYTAKNLEKAWTLVHLLDNTCDETCSKSLYNSRQIRIALGKDIDRIKRIAVVSPTAITTTDTKIWASHPDIIVLQGGTVDGLGTQIKNHTAAQQYPTYSIYLLDPLGNLMMQFDPELNPKLIMKDIKKLLRLSRIG